MNCIYVMIGSYPMKSLDGRNLNNLHFKWNSTNKPVLRVSEGEEFEVIIPDSSTMQVKRNSNLSDLRKIDSSLFDGAVGPVYVDGTEPGDCITVNIKKIETEDWGWTAIMDNFGLLKNMFSETLIVWKIEEGVITSEREILKNVKIREEPFLGVIGTAPAEGEYGMIPPQYFGGNMDNKFICAGSSVTLPVSVKGALLSFSDPHASQGDGEICGTAVETGARIVANVSIEKNRKIKHPIVRSKKRIAEDSVVCTGIGPDLYTSSQNAALSMIELLHEKGISKEEAYILCSVAGNLHISEIVDEPNFVVSMEMPENLINML